jgi:hypothetical protein
MVQKIVLKWSDPLMVSGPCETDLLDDLVRPGDYGPVSKAQLEDIQDTIISRQCESPPCTINLDQVLSLRRQSLVQKYARGLHQRSMKMGPLLLRKYEQGKSAMELGKQYDFPPLSVLRSILFTQGYDKATVKQLLREALNLESTTLLANQARLRSEVQIASQHDLVCAIDNSESEKKAKELENQMADLLLSHGVKFETEEQLRLKCRQQGFAPTATPDILVDGAHTALYIGRNRHRPVRWIECKNFYGTCNSTNKIKNQATKYVEKFGHGVMVFRYGFSEQLHSIMPEECILLSVEDYPELEAMLIISEDIDETPQYYF